MSRPMPQHLPSNELLARFGLNDAAPTGLIQDESLDDLLGDLDGDLSSVLLERYALLTVNAAPSVQARAARRLGSWAAQPASADLRYPSGGA